MALRHLLTLTTRRVKLATAPGPVDTLFEDLDTGEILLGGTVWDAEDESWVAPATGAGMQSLGNDPLAPLTISQRNALAVATHNPPVALSAASLLEVLVFQILGSLADPTGIARPKPIRMSRRRGVGIFFGSYGRLQLGDFEANTAHPNFQAALDVRIADYRRRKAAGDSLDSLQRWTGYALEQYFGRASDDFLDQVLPPEHLADGWRPHSTTIGDTFTDSDGTSLDAHTATGPNGGFEWTIQTGDAAEINGNEVSRPANNASNFCRADSDLSSDDHKSIVDITDLPAVTGRAAGPLLRYDSSAEDFYRCRLRVLDSGTNAEWIIHEYTAGSGTEILNGASFTHPTLPVTVRAEMDGSDIEIFMDDVSQETLTDTTHTGNVRCGIYFQPESGSNYAAVDNFEAADLAAAADVRKQIVAAYMRVNA